MDEKDAPATAEETPESKLQERVAALRQTGKKKRKKLLITLGTAVVVLAIVVVSGLVWHEQPSFCNTICHNPMDKYYETYASGDSGYLVTSHAAFKTECLDCHEPEVSEQISEGITWLQGDYEVDENGYMISNDTIGTREFCFRCHDDGDSSTGIDWDAIVESTSDWTGTVTVYNPNGLYNPHDNHRGSTNCADCHKMHGKSTLYCVKCHNMEVPEGWNGFE